MPSNKVTVRVRLQVRPKSEPRPDPYHTSPFYADLRSPEKFSANTFLGRPIIRDPVRSDRKVHSAGDIVASFIFVFVVVGLPIGFFFNPPFGLVILIVSAIVLVLEMK